MLGEPHAPYHTSLRPKQRSQTGATPTRSENLRQTRTAGYLAVAIRRNASFVYPPAIAPQMWLTIGMSIKTSRTLMARQR